MVQSHPPYFQVSPLQTNQTGSPYMLDQVAMVGRSGVGRAVVGWIVEERKKADDASSGRTQRQHSFADGRTTQRPEISSATPLTAQQQISMRAAPGMGGSDGADLQVSERRGKDAYKTHKTHKIHKTINEGMTMTMTMTMTMRENGCVNP